MGVRIATAGLALYLAGPLTVGLIGLGLPGALALVLSLGVSGSASHVLVRQIARGSAGGSWPPAVAVAFVTLLGAATVQMSRLSLFMNDVTRESCSVVPSDRWRLYHSCFTAYADAARFTAERIENVYELEIYEGRRQGPLRVDAYHYPPPFLLLSSGVRAAAGDFFSMRRVWFALQTIVLIAALTGIAIWIGGREGRLAGAAAALVLAAPQTAFTLQIGNFQITAICLGLLGAVLLASRRVTAGSFVLAVVTAGKIFPGAIGLYLLGARRWRPVLATAAWGIVVTTLAFVVFGRDVFASFLFYELPRIVSGDAFPQAERVHSMTANQSVYGLVTKLRQLGVPGLDRSMALRIADLYGYMVVVTAALLGMLERRFDPAPGGERLARAMVWLALLNLASFRSPFVGGGYGSVGTVWLLSLLIAGSPSWRSRAALIAAAAALFVFLYAMPGPVPGTLPPPSVYAISAAYDVLLLATNIFVVVAAVTAALRSRRVGRAGAAEAVRV